MIAVTFALPAESSDFIRILQDRSRETLASLQIIRGQLGETEVCVFHTGVGTKMARARSKSFLARAPRPELLICAGFAGALEERLQIADLFLADNFSDESALTSARQIIPAEVGKLTTAEEILDSPAARSRLASATGARAIDMETEVVVEECRGVGVRTLSLRAITDTPAFPFPLPPSILFDLAAQKTKPLRLLAYLAVHPWAIGRLIAFAGRVTRARRALTNALELLVRRAGDPPVPREPGHR
ncbi:MAG: hypothetical protein ACR2HH_10955 [Chthoniobacterales bacterium]